MIHERRWRAVILGAVGAIVLCGTVTSVCALVWAGDRAPAIVATISTSTCLLVGQVVLLGYQLRHAEESRRALAELHSKIGGVDNVRSQ